MIAAKIHPQTIISGWRKAVDCARQALTDAAKDNRYIDREIKRGREMYEAFSLQHVSSLLQ